MARARAGVGEHAEPLRAVRAGELQRLVGIVRDREGMQQEVADLDRPPSRAKLSRSGGGDVRPQARHVPSAHPQRQPVASRQGDRAADVVTVLVGDEDRVQIARSEAGSAESSLELAQAEPAVRRPG